MYNCEVCKNLLVSTDTIFMVYKDSTITICNGCYFDLNKPEHMKPEIIKICECGSDKTNQPSHSMWCNKFEG